MNDDTNYPIYHTPYQRFPAMLHKPGGQSLIVRDEVEERARMSEGWQVAPVTDAPVAVDEVIDVESVTSPTGVIVRPRGRPRKE